MKVDKDQQNLVKKQNHSVQEGIEDSGHGSVLPAAIEVDVEINVIDTESVNEHRPSPPSPLPSPPPSPTPLPIKSSSKRKSTTPQRRRRKSGGHTPPPPPAPSDSAVPTPDHQRPALVTSPSQVSIISEEAVEELCDLRNYYSKQLRRINYISQEYLQQQRSEPGVLACIREPLKSLRLPRGATIARTARNLWTRVSSRRKLVQR